MPTTKPRDRRAYFHAYYQARKAAKIPKWLTCVGCGKAMRGRSDKKFHDNACRVRTYRQFQKEIGE